ncbi:MAG: sulfotransferase [Chitinophagales bacterium]
MILIFGIYNRSGTNYLFDLLRLHPQCAITQTELWEDYLLAHTDIIEDYIRQTQKHWNKDWYENAPILRKQLYKSLSEVLQQSAPAQEHEQILSKTPSTLCIDKVFDVFPQAHVIVIVRNAKAVVESGVKSFNWKYENALRIWHQSALRILRFREKNEHFLLVKYEDLFSDTTTKLQEILQFCKLDATKYNWDAMKKLPIRGSSTLTQKTDKVHWQAVEKTANFNPLARANHWSRWQNYRYHWLCAETEKALGYKIEPIAKSPLYYSYNVLADAYHKTRFFWHKLKLIAKSSRQIFASNPFAGK